MVTFRFVNQQKTHLYFNSRKETAKIDVSSAVGAQTDGQVTDGHHSHKLKLQLQFFTFRVRLHQATRLRLRLPQRYRSEFLHLHQALSLRATVPIHFVYMS